MTAASSDEECRQRRALWDAVRSDSHHPRAVRRRKWAGRRRESLPPRVRGVTCIPPSRAAGRRVRCGIEAAQMRLPIEDGGRGKSEAATAAPASARRQCARRSHFFGSPRSAKPACAAGDVARAALGIARRPSVGLRANFFAAAEAPISSRVLDAALAARSIIIVQNLSRKITHCTPARTVAAAHVRGSGCAALRIACHLPADIYF